MRSKDRISNLMLILALAVFVPTVALAQGTWTTKTPMTTIRLHHTSGAVNGVVYVVGGQNDTGVLATMEAYDPTSDTWTTKMSMPTARTGAGAGASNGIIYVLGGLNNASPGMVVATVEAYDPTTNAWTTKAPMPTARHGLGVGVVNGILYAVGGAANNDGSGFLDVVEAYDPSTNTWTTKAHMPTARQGFAEVGVVNGLLYAIGGYNGAILQTVEAYNPGTDTWTTRTSMPTARYFPGVGVLNGTIYVAGGTISGPDNLATVEAYNPGTDTWTSDASMLTGRYGLIIEAVGGSLYAVGGGANGIALAVNEAFTPLAMTQPPTLASATFYGGAGDQRGTAIAISDGVYISGNVQPEAQSPSDTALVLKYALPSGPSPVWARSYGFGTDFFGIAATNEGVYPDGWNYSLTTDNVGGKEVKTFLAKFAGDGTSGVGPGGAIWVTGGPGNLGPFFPYSGVELFQSATTAVEGGSNFIYAAGSGQPCSFTAYFIAKYDASGNFLAKATDPGQENAFNFCSFNGTISQGSGLTVLNGNVYAVGNREVYGSGTEFPTIWKHASDLSVVWRRQDTSLTGLFNATTAFGGAIYAVGSTFIGNLPGSEDYLVQKYDEAGNLLWSQTSGGPNTDVLTGVVGIGTRLFAVGYTMSSGAGGADSVVLEIDPATGATLSTTLFGGALDDKANGAATDGTDLYVVGESRSFASAEGNAVGQNDVMLLRYTLCSPPTATVSGSTSMCTGSSAVIGATLTGAAPWNLTWSDGLTETGVMSSPETRTVSPSATTTYSVTSISDAHCTGTSSGSATVVVNPLPATPTITPSGATRFCAGGNVTLTSSAAASYLWSTGATMQSITVSSSGQYSVTVTDANGCSSSSTPTTVTVIPLPTATVFGTAAVCKGGATTIGAALTGTGPWNLTWSDGFTQTAVTASPVTRTVAPTATTTYGIAAISDANCTGTASGSATVTVNPLPATPTITASGATRFCAGGNVTLTSSAAASYLWSTGATTQSITVSSSGQYSVTVTDANGCSAPSTPTTVTVIPLPTATVFGTAAVCKGVATIIGATLTGTGPWNLTWSDGFTQTTVTASPVTRTVAPTATTTYGVAAISDANCTGTASGSAVITVEAPPKATVSGSATICVGSSATIQAALSGTAPWTLNWSDGFTQTVSVSPATRTVSPNVTTSFSVTAISDAACTGGSSGAATIQVRPLPSSVITTTPSPICAGATGVAQVPNSAGATYTWSISNGTITSGQGTPKIHFTAGTSGSVDIGVAVVSAAGCNSLPGSVSIPINPLPSSTITAPASVCRNSSPPGGNVASVPDAGAGATYSWTVMNGAIVGSTSGTRVVFQPGGKPTVTLKVTVTSSNGCTSSNSVTIAVNQGC